MSRYARLLTEDHDATSSAPATANDPPSPSDPSAPGPVPPAAAFTSNMSNMLASLKESAASAGKSARSGLGLPPANDDDSEAPSEASVLDEVSEYCPKLTFHQPMHVCTIAQRVTGFGICFTAGYLMTFASFRLFVKLVAGNPAPFVFLYSSGNLLSLMSSMFLSGPKRQFKSMFDEKRRTTSITYLATLATSIAVCFIPMPTGPKIGLLVLLLLVQMSASLWYTLSYIPYGRATARRMIQSFISGDE
ncbi:hypothetical protein ACHAXT_007991 [Thalassiosira profunda]